MRKFAITPMQFTGPNGLEAWCDVHTLELDDGLGGRIGRCLVVVSERPDNPGMSVTNAAELIATLVCDRLEIAPARLVYVEHYTAPKQTYDQVTFKLAPGRGPGPQWPDTRSHFFLPHWWPMQQADWAELGLDDPREVTRDADGGPH